MHVRATNPRQSHVIAMTLRGKALALPDRMPRAKTTGTEGVRGWHEFEAVLPAQYFRAPGVSSLQPEKRLMLAVLEDAVVAYLRGPAFAPDTTEWFASDDTSWPYSFANLCDSLNLDREAVRSALQRRRDRRLVAAYAA